MFVSVLTDCGDIDVPRGFVNSTFTSPGDVIEVTCVPGYIIKGPSVVTCLEHSLEWSGSPKCEIAGIFTAKE